MKDEVLKNILLAYRDELKISFFPVIIKYDEAEKKNTKRPAISWKEFQPTPTDEEIDAWSKRYTCFGMPTGELSRIVVVDVDTTDLGFVEDKLKVVLHSNLEVKTGGGGTHIYYRWSDELRNTVRIDGSPVDFRGDGGFVVIPPSAGDWGKYEWETIPTANSRMYMPDLPKQIRKLLTTNKTKVSVTLTSTDGVFKDGERNTASTVALRRLLGDIPQSAWVKTGWLAFQQWGQTKCQPALSMEEMKATFSWWVRTNAKPDVPSTVGKSLMQVGMERIEERQLEKTAPTTGYKSLDAFVKGWIPGHLYVFTGETNAGKSAAACNFAYRVAIQDKKVTYFALEPDVGVVEYIAGIHHKKKWQDITDDDLKMDIPGITVYTKDSQAKLESLLKTIETMERQDLIIVDHIGYFTNDDSKMSKTEKESDAIKRIVSMAKKKGTAVMIIAHPRKPSTTSSKVEKPLNMNEISGSASFKQDGTDILILHMTKQVENNEFKLINSPDGFILLPKVKTGRAGSFKIRFIPESPIMIDETEIAEKELKAINGEPEQVRF